MMDTQIPLLGFQQGVREAAVSAAVLKTGRRLRNLGLWSVLYVALKNWF